MSAGNYGENKLCPGCNKWKNLSNFYRSSYTKDGFYRLCKKCWNEYSRDYTSKNKKKAKKRAKKYYHKTGWKKGLDKNYGEGASDYYEAKSLDQKDKCEICGKINSGGKRLNLDHNHITGQWRGLLCHSCNIAIGNLQVDKNSDLLYKSIKYMEKYNVGG